jgi:hypothetical protein
MTITIEIPPKLERHLRQEAARFGLAPEAYIVEASDRVIIFPQALDDLGLLLQLTRQLAS